MATPKAIVTMSDNNALPNPETENKVNTLPGKSKAFVKKHEPEKIDKMGDKGSEENQFTADGVKKDETKKASYRAGKDAEVYEETMSDAEKAKRERIVKGMKKNAPDFKAKYGDRWKSVMYATATKAAMEEVELEEGMPSSVIKSKQKYAEMSDKDFADKHGSKSETELKAMAWRHGYGKDSNIYVNKAKKGSMAEEAELTEGTGKYFATAEKSKFKDGWRPHLKNPQGKTSYLGAATFKNKADAIAHAAAYHQHVNVKGLNPDRMKSPDKSKLVEATLSAKAGAAGKDLGKPGKNFAKIVDDATERYGSKEAGKRVAGAILAKMRKEDFNLAEEDGRRLRDNLKSEGKHEEAGAIAHKYGLGRSYGPHFGMRSTKNAAEMAFHKGYDKAAILAKKSVKEDLEQIDEISKSTLGSYATKALRRGDIAARMSHSDTDEMGKIATKRMTGVKKAVERIATKKAATAIKTNVDRAKEAARNRGTDKDDQGKAYYAAQKGISKVREDVEHINELKKSTVVSYLNKASKSKDDAIGQVFKGAAMGAPAKDPKTLAKRNKGISLGVGKIVGMSRVAAKEDVKNELLNKLYESLSESNKKLMDAMLEDGRVDELLEFAMEQFNDDV